MPLPTHRILRSHHRPSPWLWYGQCPLPASQASRPAMPPLGALLHWCRAIWRGFQTSVAHIPHAPFALCPWVPPGPEEAAPDLVLWI